MSDQRRWGGWFQTFTVRPFFPEDPWPEDIAIQDIAHALSLECRFGGHCRVHYSVAQHSIHVSEIMEKRFGCAAVPGALLAGLLHDASEAYLKDVVHPLKRSPVMAGYRQLEEHLQRLILATFGVHRHFERHATPIKQADMVALATEARDLLGPLLPGWECSQEPDAKIIVPMTCPEAEAAFLERFHRLEREMG